MHDEGFDKNLVDAKHLFNKADEATRKLKNKDSGIDYRSDKEKLVVALTNAREELIQKADALRQEPDSVLVEEAKAIDQRVMEIEKAINVY